MGLAIASGRSHFHLTGALALLIPTGGTVSQRVTCPEHMSVMSVIGMVCTELSSPEPPNDVLQA